MGARLCNMSDPASISKKSVVSTSASSSKSVLSTPTKQGRSLTQSIRARISRSFSSDDSRLSTISISSSVNTTPSSEPSVPPSLSQQSFPPAPSSTSPPLVPSIITPPPFPSPALYTSCYCEENIYHLTAYLLSHIPSSSWQVHVVFISNSTRTVLLYSQSASQLPDAGWPVIWDYHVIAVVTCGKKRWVYDFDSTLSEGGRRVIPWKEYLEQTFRSERVVREELKAKFRCVEGKDFLNWFASDRRHMLVKDEEGVSWHAKPPSWEMVVGEEARREGVVNNLMDRYVDMMWDQHEGVDERSKGRYGRVWDWNTWLERGCLPGHQDQRSGSSSSSVRDDQLTGKATMRLADGHEPPSTTSDSSHTTTRDQRTSTPSASTDAPEQDTFKKGGRIVSPLFPAYLHASQQHRSQLPPPLTPPSTVTSFTVPTPL